MVPEDHEITTPQTQIRTQAQAQTQAQEHAPTSHNSIWSGVEMARRLTTGFLTFRPAPLVQASEVEEAGAGGHGPEQSYAARQPTAPGAERTLATAPARGSGSRATDPGANGNRRRPMKVRAFGLLVLMLALAVFIMRSAMLAYSTSPGLTSDQPDARWTAQAITIAGPADTGEGTYSQGAGVAGARTPTATPVSAAAVWTATLTPTRTPTHPPHTPTPTFTSVPTRTPTSTSTPLPPPTPPAPPPTNTPVRQFMYVVRPGDTLSGIAIRFGVTVDQIRWANGLSGDMIYAGQVLRIPLR